MKDVKLEGFWRPVAAPARARLLPLCFTLLLLPAAATAQNAPGTSSPVAPPTVASLPDAPTPHTYDPDAVTVRNTPRHVLWDQAAIWTSPVRLQTRDLVWLVPLAGAMAATLATDRHTMTEVVPSNAQFNHNNVDASNAMLGLLVAVPVTTLGYGEFGHHEHARVTGILGAETAVDSAIVEQGMKLIFLRERPGVDNAHGKFWQTSVGPDSSFPSSHTVFAWSMAAMIAGEYPSPWSQLTVYSLATGVSVTRVLGREHFPSDVLVGSAAGWLVGHSVYKVRHRWQQRGD